MKKLLLIFICGAALIASYNIGAQLRPQAKHKTHTDTITIFDTIQYYMPVTKDSTIIKYITIKPPDINDETYSLPTTDNVIQSDSSSIIIPITQKVYTDNSTYTAFVSGYMVSLDSLLFTRRTEINTAPCLSQKDKRWSVGIHAGYGITMSSIPQFTPYIGVGLTYKLFSF